jgi:hypothetical protein
MKPLMKNRFVFPISLAVLILSCTYFRAEPEYLNDAVITGFDGRKCMCCGGLIINFNHEIKSYAGEFYLLENLPSEMGIDDSTKFPMRRIVGEAGTLMTQF